MYMKLYSLVTSYVLKLWYIAIGAWPQLKNGHEGITLGLSHYNKRELLANCLLRLTAILCQIELKWCTPVYTLGQSLPIMVKPSVSYCYSALIMKPLCRYPQYNNIKASLVCDAPWNQYLSHCVTGFELAYNTYTYMYTVAKHTSPLPSYVHNNSVVNI